MIKINLKSGYIAYKASSYEAEMVGRNNTCDYCRKPLKNGYLVPALNFFLCSYCFNRWELVANYYIETLDYERKTSEYYESMNSVSFNETSLKIAQPGDLQD